MNEKSWQEKNLAVLGITPKVSYGGVGGDVRVNVSDDVGSPYKIGAVMPLMPQAVNPIDVSKIQQGFIDIRKGPVSTPEKAHTFLEEASTVMKQRAALRDKPEGERSMESIVKTFNALAGKDLTEAEGWEFMILLKMVRGRQGKYNRDDYVDGSAYFGLLGECKSGDKQ